MTKKLRKTTKDFVEEVYNLVKDEYTVLSEYLGSREIVKFKHNTCGNEYETKAYIFTNNGSRCPVCNKGVKKSHDEYKKQIKNLGNDEYELLGKYKNSNTKIEIRHLTCGYEWSIFPTSFLQGSRCPKCSFREMGDKFRNEPSEFMKKFYDTSDEYELLSEYVDSNTKIKIKHNECGNEYDVFPYNFLSGRRCNTCASRIESDKRISISSDKFSKYVAEHTDNEYEVVNGSYVNAKTYVKILHNECGTIYDVLSSAFRRGNRCPKCKQSKGENEISKCLTDNNIKFTPQYSFDIDGFRLYKYDFAILNDEGDVVAIIEFDGEQHFRFVEFFHKNVENFKKSLERDKLKNKLVKSMGIKMLRIKYNEEIEAKLKNFLQL